MRSRHASAGSFVLALVATLVALACPIYRPAVPTEYFGFRADLERAVEDTVGSLLERRPASAVELEDRLSLLSSYTRVDSVVAGLARADDLRLFADAVDAAVRSMLASDETGGGVRKAFERPEGQRLAVDGIVIGLGRAIRMVRREPGGAERGRR